MTDTPRRWDRLTAESDPAFEAFAAYLDTGSLRDAYRQRSGKAQATAAPGAWTGWSTKYNWVSRRAAYVEFTVRECQDAIQIGLVQIRKRLIDAANKLLDTGGVPAVRAASRVIVENFPPVARVADVSDGEQIEDLCDIPDADLERMREIRDAARAKAQAKVSDGRAGGGVLRSAWTGPGRPERRAVHEGKGGNCGQGVNQ